MSFDFFFFFMVNEWGLLMVDEWGLCFSSFVVDGFMGFSVSMLMVDLWGSFWLIWIFGSGCGWLFLAC